MLCFRLESLVAQQALHSDLELLRCEKHITEAMRAKAAEADHQVS